MKIRLKLPLFFGLLLIMIVGVFAYYVYDFTKNSIIESELNSMNHEVIQKSVEIETLHARASEDLIFALKNPLFVEYFELPETKAGNVYNDGVLQFTDRQNQIKTKLENWIYNFQSKFDVDETCIIDMTGQEHARLVLKQIEINENLSPEENGAPFFEASFKKMRDEVHVQYPYVSPDTNRWVFAYTSPVVLGDEQKPAFYHFEMPLTIFQNLIDVESGRMYIADKKGYLVADSKFDFTTRTVKETPIEYFPSVRTISASSDFQSTIQQLSTPQGVKKYYDDEGHEHYIVFKKLPNFEWVLVYEKPTSDMIYGSTTLGDLKIQVFAISVVFATLGLFGIFMLSNGIVRPIKKLEQICLTNDPDNIAEIKIKSNDETGSVVNALNSLMSRISEKNEEIRFQNEELRNQSEELEAQREELQMQNKQLLDVDKQKAEFASMVTHELKTPITPIMSWCEVLLDHNVLGQLNEGQKNAVTKIRHNAVKLLGLISDILDAEKLGLGQMKFNLRDVNIEKFVKELSENYAPVLAEKKIQYVVSCPKNLTIHIDESRLAQVLKNFINNSMDFVPKENAKIELKIEQDSKFATFSVIDNGIGIPKEKQQNLFKKFYQIDTSATRKHGGSGLGLSICKGIIESFRGMVGVKSEPGIGSIFYFKIPLKSDVAVVA